MGAYGCGYEHFHNPYFHTGVGRSKAPLEGIDFPDAQMSQLLSVMLSVKRITFLRF
jgi:hypothetical protein